MKQSEYFSIAFRQDKFIFLDQTKLPHKENYVETESYERIAQAIEKLEVRGAPAIGITTAFAVALALKNVDIANRETEFYNAYKRLAKTRPTAVNLFYALNEQKKIFEENKNHPDLYLLLVKKAREIHERDIEYCRKIGENGLKIFRKKSNVLTHCNTGKLATGGDGTAFNVIRNGFQHGLVNMVYADETRPLQQGLRLTSFELEKNNIPFFVQSDSSAAALMKDKKVDLVIVGADRIALNGDTANKIGTYNLAVLCNYHEIPFYVAAPTTTIDRTISTGDEIIIEFRNKNELITINDISIAPESCSVFSPAFDVTPSHLITGIITEDDIYFFPYNFLK